MALRELAERDGLITPQTVLEAASEPSSPLHDHFTWDDTEAARKYRLVEARSLITRYKITVQKSPDETVRVRAFAHIPAEDGAGFYVPTADALTDPAQRSLVMQQALREVAALRRKYQALVDFDAVLADAMSERAHEAA